MFDKKLIDVNQNPLQTNSQDTLLKSVTVGGPEKEGDRRIYLDKKTLLELVEIAKSSVVQRVQINRAGIQVNLYQRADGHTYEIWKLVGIQPVPESVMDGLFAKD